MQQHHSNSVAVAVGSTSTSSFSAHSPLPNNPEYSSRYLPPNSQSPHESQSMQDDYRPEDNQSYPANATPSGSLAVTQKGRSVIACSLCRKQKMKCEGPEKAPCRRCRLANVECIFEAPAQTTPRPRASAHGNASESWVDSRIQPLVDRVHEIESSISPSGPHHPRHEPIPPVHAILSDHEHRISQLEAQLYAMQFAGPPPSHPLALPVAPHLDPHPGYHHNHSYHSASIPAMYNNASPYPFPHHLQSMPPPSNGGSPGSMYGRPPSPAASSVRSPYGVPSHPYGPSTSDFRSTASSTPAPSSREMGGGGERHSHGIKREGGVTGSGASPSSSSVNDASRPEKRRKGSREEDIVARGLVSADDAAACFDAYFFSLDHRPAGSEESPIQLPLAETRAASPLLFATIVFIGARSLARSSIAIVCLEEATRLCQESYLSDVSLLTFKAVVLLGLYTGLTGLLGQTVFLCYDLGVATAMFEYEALTAEEQASRKGALLISKGRTFLVSWLWVAYYTGVAGRPGAYSIPDEVVLRQLDILDASPHTRPSTDRTLRVTLMECQILIRVFDQLGNCMRMAPATYEEAARVVEEGISELLSWSKEHLDVMETLTVWGDSTELKTAIPFHHGRLRLLVYIFRSVPDSDESRDLPRVRDFARMARESALIILRWGLESRIWLPHSMIAMYLHNINIPTAVTLLYRASRLFPGDTNFGLVRTLLHRLLRQCDNSISANTGTTGEVARARLTRELVVEFDRFAFEEYGSHPDELPVEPECFDDELAGSLGALGAELNLFGCVLLDGDE